MGSGVDRAIRELYARSPGDFTRARDARAAALKAAGDAEAAAAVRKLRRPTHALWAVNRLAHVDDRHLREFLETVDEVRRTQLHDPRTAAEGLRRQRAQLDALVGRASELLAAEGQPATPATQRRISDTLLGAAADRTLARQLAEGRLTAEHGAPGFEVLAGAPRGSHLQLVPGRQPDRPPPRTSRTDHDQAADRTGRAEARRRAEAERQAEAQRQAEAEREAERRRRAAIEELEREATDRRAEAGAARREVERLTGQASAARGRLREAEHALRAAEAAVRKARGGPARSTARRGRARGD
jgi:hypothetical protein